MLGHFYAVIMRFVCFIKIHSHLVDLTDVCLVIFEGNTA